MKKLKVVEWLAIFVFIIVAILLVLSTTYVYDPVEIAEPSANILTELNFSAKKDSLTIRSLRDLLYDDIRNNEVKILLKSLLMPDSLENNPSMAKIISINQVPWEEVLDTESRHRLLKGKSYRNTNENFYFLILEYRGRQWEILISPSKINAGSSWSKVTMGLIFLSLLIYIMFICRKHAYAWCFRLIYFIYALIITLSIEKYTLYCVSIPGYQKIDEINEVALLLLFYLPLLYRIKLRYRYYFFIPVFILLLSIVFPAISSGGLVYLLLIIPILFLLFSERGINLKFYLEFIYFICIAFGIFYFVELFVTLSFVDQAYTLTKEMWLPDTISGGFLNFNNYIWGITLGSIAIVLVFLIYGRAIRMHIRLLERIFSVSILILLTTILSQLFSVLTWAYYKNIDTDVLVIIGGLIIAFIASWVLINFIPLFRPVRFSLNKKILELLNKSYEFTESKAYAEYYLSFIKSLNSHYKIAFYSLDGCLGELFEAMSPQRLQEVSLLINREEKMLNIDLELLNDTDKGKELQDFDRRNMPHLLLPVYDDAGEQKAIIALGKMPGVYWHASLAKALAILTDVFRGFYVNFLAQQELREKSAGLIKEQEARLFNQRLALLTQEKNTQLEAEKQRIMESIQYASLIQKSILPQSSDLDAVFPQWQILWKPRDIVGGDIYWLYQIPDTRDYLFAVVDCTGHGVPGALMSVAASSALDRIVKDHKLWEPAQILMALHQHIGMALHQKSEKSMQDGMDISLLRYEPEKRKLSFAGAKQQLLIFDHQSQSLSLYAGTKHSIGGLRWRESIEYAQEEISLPASSTLYMFTDGIVDQVTKNDQGKLCRFGSKAWQGFLQQIAMEDLPSQKAKLEILISEMLELDDQRDDICVAILQCSEDI